MYQPDFKLRSVLSIIISQVFCFNYFLRWWSTDIGTLRGTGGEQSVAEAARGGAVFRACSLSSKAHVLGVPDLESTVSGKSSTTSSSFVSSTGGWLSILYGAWELELLPVPEAILPVSDGLASTVASAAASGGWSSCSLARACMNMSRLCLLSVDCTVVAVDGRLAVLPDIPVVGRSSWSNSIPCSPDFRYKIIIKCYSTYTIYGIGNGRYVIS